MRWTPGPAAKQEMEQRDRSEDSVLLGLPSPKDSVLPGLAAELAPSPSPQAPLHRLSVDSSATDLFSGGSSPTADEPRAKLQRLGTWHLAAGPLSALSWIPASPPSCFYHHGAASCNVTAPERGPLAVRPASVCVPGPVREHPEERYPLGAVGPSAFNALPCHGRLRYSWYPPGRCKARLRVRV
jgi:hypothetical protein